jgi:alpha-D-xyloside xylohydrolase
MSYESREEIEDTVNKMAAFGMSVDVIHIDGWMDSWQPDASKDILTFDERRFPDPEGMINWLKERGVHLSLWMYPYIAATRIDRRTKKRIGESEQYKYMNSRGFLVKNNEGNTYVFGLGEGDVAGEGVAALDFTNPECVAYVSERVKRLMRMNVGVIKTDFSEEIPEDAVFYDGSTGLLGHNKYTLLYAKTIYEASRDEKEKMGQRALLWGRSGFSGSQNYPANWAGDSSAAKNNLSAILNGGLSIGISGVSFWGFDIGGFYNCDYQGNRVVPDDEDYIRSVQMGLMSPLSRSHGQGTPREPWIFSKTAQKAFLYINKLRYRLLPYIYSTAYETHYFGYPMMRAMILEYPEDLNVRNLSTQYMLGSSLLVAPVFDQQIQHVYLPHGSWVDMNTGEIIDGDRWIAPEKNIERIPVYLRSDSVIAMYETAPMHIDDRNFAGYDLIMNLDDHISASIFDDNNIGKVDVQQRNHEVIISTDSIDYSHIRIYSSDVIEKVIINGTEQEWTREGESLYI